MRPSLTRIGFQRKGWELILPWFCVEYHYKPTSSGVERKVVLYRMGRWEWQVSRWAGR